MIQEHNEQLLAKPITKPEPTMVNYGANFNKEVLCIAARFYRRHGFRATVLTNRGGEHLLFVTPPRKWHGNIPV